MTCHQHQLSSVLPVYEIPRILVPDPDVVHPSRGQDSGVSGNG